MQYTLQNKKQIRFRKFEFKISYIRIKIKFNFQTITEKVHLIQPMTNISEQLTNANTKHLEEARMATATTNWAHFFMFMFLFFIVFQTHYRAIAEELQVPHDCRLTRAVRGSGPLTQNLIKSNHRCIHSTKLQIKQNDVIKGNKRSWWSAPIPHKEKFEIKVNSNILTTISDELQSSSALYDVHCNCVKHKNV